MKLSIERTTPANEPNAQYKTEVSGKIDMVSDAVEIAIRTTALLINSFDNPVEALACAQTMSLLMMHTIEDCTTHPFSKETLDEATKEAYRVFYEIKKITSDKE